MSEETMEQVQQPADGGQGGAEPVLERRQGVPAPQANAPNDPSPEEEEDEELSWESWIAKQEERVRKLYEAHVAGLKSALEAQKAQRKRVAEQLQETVNQLETLRKQYQEEASRLAFYEQASAEGVRHPKLAWYAAQELGAFDEQGTCDFAKLRSHYPELFRRATPVADAGAGAEQGARAARSMNEVIRAATGRRVG